MDLFASSMTTHCPLWFALSHTSPLGLDALAHEWPRTRLYAFPPIQVLSVVLLRIRAERVEHLLLLSPWWPTQSWFSDMVSLLFGPPWEIPLRHDLLTQARRHDLVPSTGLMEAMGVATERGMLMRPGISAETSNTIINSRAPSTRCLYAFKWRFFTLRCRQRTLDPVHCAICSVLEFLQSCFSEGVTPATLKVNVVPISARKCTRRRCSSGSSPFGVPFYAEAFPSNTSSFLGSFSCLGRLVGSSF